MDWTGRLWGKLDWAAFASHDVLNFAFLIKIAKAPRPMRGGVFAHPVPSALTSLTCLCARAYVTTVLDASTKRETTSHALAACRRSHARF